MTGLRTSMELQDVLIAGGIREAKTLVKEPAEFGGAGHDDLAVALALGVWGVRLRAPGGAGELGGGVSGVRVR